MRSALLMVTVLGCGGGGGDKTVDAAVAVDAHVVTGTALTHTLFVNTEGAMVSAGADDATLDKSSIARGATTLKPFLAGDAQRATPIAEIVAQLHTTLAAYDVEIVTTRPAAGPYQMLVVTDDTAMAFGGIGPTSLNPVSCNAHASVISYTFPTGTTPAAHVRNLVANLGVAMFGFLAGIPLSKVAGDCMCLADQACNATFDSQICTIGGAGIAIDDGNGGIGTCGVTDATMDEHARFLAAFGPH